MASATTSEIALNAAGIADAFRFARVADHDGDNRYQSLANHFGGWVGIVQAIAEAAAEMERFRRLAGKSASWGEDLPFCYDAWSAVGRGLWEDLPRHSAEEVARERLRRLVYEVAIEEWDEEFDP